MLGALDFFVYATRMVKAQDVPQATSVAPKGRNRVVGVDGLEPSTSAL